MNAPAEPRILAESDAWLVLDKPVGWHTVARGVSAADDSDVAGHADHAAGHGPTVEAWLRTARPEQAALPEAGLVQRLDEGTSGCLLAARSAAAHESLRREISELGGSIRKRYLAALRPGVAAEGSFRLYFTGRHASSAKVTVSERGEARNCGRCRWTRIASSAAADLVEVELLGPGRRHQVRAGFAHLGHPLLGDALYRGDPAPAGLAARRPGAWLHAWSLEVDGRRIEAPPPEPWSHLHEAISARRREPER